MEWTDNIFTCLVNTGIYVKIVLHLSRVHLSCFRQILINTAFIIFKIAPKGHLISSTCPLNAFASYFDFPTVQVSTYIGVSKDDNTSQASTMDWKSSFGLCVILQFSLIQAVSVSEFYPFGRLTDQRLPVTDDGNSGELTLSASFPFFKSYYQRLFVSTIINFRPFVSLFRHAFPNRLRKRYNEKKLTL